MDELLGNLWISPNVNKRTVNGTTYYEFQAGSTITSSAFPTTFNLSFIFTMSNLDLQRSHVIKIVVNKPDGSTANYSETISKEKIMGLDRTDSITYSGILEHVKITKKGIYTFTGYVDDINLSEYKMLFIEEP
ncbi:hypothetical protein LOB10_04005 [Lactobacillus delbrueckii subsp. lactis]|mgnify:CR=1 FL=1|uniref:hypothetical protein n=1 Tax=Lactobacillus delbrueckii TaxID=1584 RepID=UPI001E4D59AE|nr:hypothetical protein [Lactobacillus delbrueckii]MCD5529243.1 hypothetical protein [Lactobacillus delbrueckii subsp. lactis]MCS8608130.1 hypothetical protein [Lactobacillus delbrueckii subsp. lactis]